MRSTMSSVISPDVVSFSKPHYLTIIFLYMPVVESSMVDAENQTEFDTSMTVRALGDLDRQGLPESYENSVEKEPTHITTYSDQDPLGALPVTSSAYSETPPIVDYVVSASINEDFVSAECFVEGNVTINDCAFYAPIAKDVESVSVIKDDKSTHINTSCIVHLS